MPLRQIIQGNPETLSDMLLTADDRYREAEQLILAQEFEGAIYLLGYAAEIWLKAACMLLQGHKNTTLVKSTLAPLRKWMQSVSPTVPFTDYHDLAFFAEAILQLRLHIGRPLAAGLAADLQTQVVRGLQDEWIVDMRYRRSGLTATDAWPALAQTWWVKNNWINLI